MISYTVATNLITVTGYSEATPCNFTDLYNADKAGTLSLHARTGITAADGAAVAVDRAERPADYIVLGGASNDLYITVANWNGTTATIRITGTDRDGAAQTEDIVVNANGNYYTTKWFKTITHTQVTSATVTSFDYDLTQGQWGVIWKQSTNQFYINAGLIIGNDSDNTYLKTEKEHIKIQETFRWTVNGNFQSGKIDANGNTSDGSSITVVDAGWTTAITNYDMTSGNCSALFYDSKIVCNGGIVFGKSSGSTFKAIDCNISALGYALYGIETELKRVTTVVGSKGFGVRATYTTPITDIVIQKSPQGFFFYSSYSGTVKDSIIKYNIYDFKLENCSSNNYVIDTISSWIFLWSNSLTAKVYRQYTFNLKVLDTNQNNVENATVILKDKDGTQIFSLTTNASGEITEQTVSYGYYNQANGNTLQSYSPHTIEIRKAGYKTYKKKFTMDSKTDWTIALQRIAINIDMEVIA